MDQRMFLGEHEELTRRYFLKAGVAGVVAGSLVTRVAVAQETAPKPRPKDDKAGARPEPYFTPAADFRDVSRGKPMPHTLPEEKTTRGRPDARDVEAGSRSPIRRIPAKLGKPLTKATAPRSTSPQLLKLGEKHAVRFAKVMTCLNIGCPLGMGIWEGVPLREVVWLHEADGEPAPRVLLRLSQRRPEADVPQLAAGRPRARRSVRPAAGDPVLQAQRRVARPRARRAGARRRARSTTGSSRSSG